VILRIDTIMQYFTSSLPDTT